MSGKLITRSYCPVLPVTSRVISVIIAAFPVYPLDILLYISHQPKEIAFSLILASLTADVYIKIDADQSTHSVQDSVEAPSD